MTVHTCRAPPPRTLASLGRTHQTNVAIPSPDAAPCVQQPQHLVWCAGGRVPRDNKVYLRLSRFMHQVHSA